MDITPIYRILPLLLGWLGDKRLGDPDYLPHPIVGFGKLISAGERLLNRGRCRQCKGAIFTLALVAGSFFFMSVFLRVLYTVHPFLSVCLSTVIVFFCLAGKTLIDEVREVFIATDISVEEGRKQVARIVGRDTSALSPQQIRTAALETLAENLSDGVIAPLCWYLLLGVPGMFAYKMVNTLDSMIGYKNERYKQFGCWAARIDDVANYIPARLTAGLMVLVSGKPALFSFVAQNGKRHASPNSGYPEAALAGILHCRFGGPHIYFGQEVDKPYIGDSPKILTREDMETAIAINRKAEALMIALLVVLLLITNTIIP